MFSSTVIEPKRRMFWKVRQMPSAVRRYAGRSPISLPSKRMCPASALSAPVTRLKKVVLPAPFGPMIAWIPPASTVRSSFERTTSFPKIRESPSTASSGALTAQGEPGQQGRVEQPLRPHEHHDQHEEPVEDHDARADRKSTRLNSSHTVISYAVFCLKKKKQRQPLT